MDQIENEFVDWPVVYTHINNNQSIIFSNVETFKNSIHFPHSKYGKSYILDVDNKEKKVNFTDFTDDNSFKMFENLQIQLKMIKNDPKSTTEDKASVLLKCAHLKFMVHDFSTSYKYLRKLAKLYEKDKTCLNNVDLLHFYIYHCGIYSGLQNWNETKLCLQKVENLLYLCKNFEPHENYWIYQTIGTIYAEIDDIKNAKKHIEKAIEIQGEKKQPKLGHCYNILGKIYRKEKNFDMSINYYSMCIEETNLEDDSNEKLCFLFSVYTNMGYALYSKGNHQKTYEIYLKGLDIITNNINLKEIGNFNKAIFYHHLALVVYELKMYKECIEYGTLAIKFFESKNPLITNLVLELVDKFTISKEKLNDTSTLMPMIYYLSEFLSVKPEELIPKNKIICHCGVPSPIYKCSKCHTIYYCSKECQKKDWVNHKVTCEKKSNKF